MVLPAPAQNAPSAALISQLGEVCRGRGLPALATELAALQRWIAEDLARFEDELAVVDRGERVVQRAAHHLLDLGGKHLRPMCVALASKLGGGFDEAARQLAVAIELVHTATLLHDDVVDLGARRRGAPAARMLYGNAASIFAGDWLLVEALRRVRGARVPGLLDAMLATIDEMILAESLQLERRGRVRGPVSDYFRVVEGKTASLFRWAMLAGGRAGGLDDEACGALQRFGVHLGVAFQAVDDYLDFGGESSVTGKALFADLREGKVTYPLLVAFERDPSLADDLERALADAGDEPLPPAAVRALADGLAATGALADTLTLAKDRVAEAIACLAGLPDGPGKDALATVARATVYREK